MESGDARSDGRAVTVSIKLPPNERYYAYIYSSHNEAIAYSLIIRDKDEEKKGVETADTLNDSLKLAENGKVSAATNQDDAGIIPFNTDLEGRADGRYLQWYAFKTLGEEAVYDITLVNKTPGSGAIDLELYNKYGKKLDDLRARSDGKAVTVSTKLRPNTTFAILIDPYYNQIIDYSFIVRAPEAQKAEEATLKDEKKDLVFEKPFELNSTQVMFKAESDVFVDEDAVREILKPVAEIILKHPNHPILLAGTTATHGDPSVCVELSNKRAVAVKNLLVNAFKVPETQLKTIGLGYEKDPFVRGKDVDAAGNFIESEGAKNRRVIIMDANDPVAKKLLP